MKKIRALTICLIILIIVIIILLVFKFINKTKNNNVIINDNYYLVATEKEENGKIELIDIIHYELKIDNNYMTFCYKDYNECTTISYIKNNSTYEIDTWGEDYLSGKFFIFEDNKEELIIEKTISENTKIIHYFSTKITE